MRQWWEKVKWNFAKWMQGRYGQDGLSAALLILALVLILLSSILNAVWINLIALALLVWSTFRSYSKNIEKRRAEYDAWMRMTKPVRQWFSLLQKRWADRKSYRYFRCPKCHQALRVPKGKGKIAITCKSCGERFTRKT